MYIKEVEITPYITILRCETDQKVNKNDVYVTYLNDISYFFLVNNLRTFKNENSIRYLNYDFEVTLHQSGFKNHIASDQEIDVRDFIGLELYKSNNSELEKENNR
jgi:hypothetical protein